MKEHFLTPINIPEPPPHTQIPIRCFTCKKFDVCSIKEDYLKTAALIQRVLGDPQEDRELSELHGKHLCDYRGYNFHKPEDYFPVTITTTTEDETGTYLDAKWRNYDIVQVIYMIDEKYYVMFNIFYDKFDKEFKIEKGREIYYGGTYELSDESRSQILVGLEGWREEMIEKEQENEKYDVINTTHFSANLNCDFYEGIKGLNQEEGIKKIIKKYPHGVPCRDGSLYHLATFHIEPYKVPKYHPENGQVAFMPMPYPVFIPKPANEKPPRRREDYD